MIVGVPAEPARTSTQNRLDTAAPSNREKTASGRVIQLDFVRGIAILMVMSHHFLSWPTNSPIAHAMEFQAAHLASDGVDLFFVLSGFLVGGLLYREIRRSGSLRVGRFMARRMFRIWPAYYVYLLFQVVTRHFPLSTFLVANLLHMQNYLGTSLEHTWTLAVEEHFYLLLPLLLLLFESSRLTKAQAPRILLGICVAVMLLRTIIVLLTGSAAVASYTHTRLDSLMLGVFLSHLYYYRRALFDRISQQRVLLVAMVCTGVAFLSWVPAKSPWMLTIGFTVNSLCFAALLLLMLQVKGKVVSGWAYRAVAWIGLYSYSIFLWHLSVRKPIYSVMHLLPANDGLRWTVLYCAQFASAIVLGVVMTKLVERPFLRLRERVVPARSRIATERLSVEFTDVVRSEA